MVTVAAIFMILSVFVFIPLLIGLTIGTIMVIADRRNRKLKNNPAKQR